MYDVRCMILDVKTSYIDIVTLFMSDFRCAMLGVMSTAYIRHHTSDTLPHILSGTFIPSKAIEDRITIAVRLHNCRRKIFFSVFSAFDTECSA